MCREVLSVSLLANVALSTRIAPSHVYTWISGSLVEAAEGLGAKYSDLEPALAQRSGIDLTHSNSSSNVLNWSRTRMQRLPVASVQEAPILLILACVACLVCLLIRSRGGPAHGQAIRSGAILLSLTLTSPLAAQFNGVQVNVNAMGRDIIGDAANEPSIAVDPNDPNRIAIGWRQFNTVSSSFRQAGIGYSTDGGQTWTKGVLDPGVFRSDPVLDFDADGNFYYSSLHVGFGNYSVDVFKSTDGGATWSNPVPAFGGDKPWIAIDRTDGIGRGNIYQHWTFFLSQVPDTSFTRSVDEAASFEAPFAAPTPYLGVGMMDVGPDGTLYAGGISQKTRGHLFAKSTNAQDPAQVPAFAPSEQVNLGGTFAAFSGVNPGGFLGQVNVATDHSGAESHGDVYMLASVNPPGPDPTDVMFVRSTDQGETWSDPIRVNDDPIDNGAFQWFGTMSVAPNGRIDAVWNDTRHDPTHNTSVLYYAYSYDAGESWLGSTPLSEPFNHSLGYPGQNKLGDYYDMISHDDAAYLAYAATFTGGQDIYFLRIDAEPRPDLVAIPEPSTLLLGAVSVAFFGIRMARKRLFALLALAAAAVTLAQPAASTAQESFIDTFDDGNVQDGIPVRWRGLSGEQLDASSGDLVLTPTQDRRFSIATALPFRYDDVSIRTQLVVPEEPFIDAGIVARLNRGSLYMGTITSDDYLLAPNSLVISAIINDPVYEILTKLPTTLDPTKTEVTLQFDLAGDLLMLTAWSDGTPKELLIYHDNRLQQGGIGLQFDDGVREFFFDRQPGTATFRFFDARPVLLGDYNRNGQVEQGDLDLMLLNWGNDGTTIPAGWELDFPERTIDQQELDKVLLNWGNASAAVRIANVPEPSTMLLALVALIVVRSRYPGGLEE